MKGWTCCSEERANLSGGLVREGSWEDVLSQPGFEGRLGVLWTVGGAEGIAWAKGGLA